MRVQDGVCERRDQRFESRSEHKKTVTVFPSQKCCTDSLSVCPTPVCIRTHQNDHVRTLKILQSMSEFGGLRKHENTAHRTKQQIDSSQSPGKSARMSHALHWDKTVV